MYPALSLHMQYLGNLTVRVGSDTVPGSSRQPEKAANTMADGLNTPPIPMAPTLSDDYLLQTKYSHAYVVTNKADSFAGALGFPLHRKRLKFVKSCFTRSGSPDR